MFFAPFLMLVALVFFGLIALLFALVQIGIIRYAFGALGLPPELAFTALLVSLIGSYINIPVTRIDGGTHHDAEFVDFFGMRYPIPSPSHTSGTIVAINLGGAITPILISLYVLMHQAGAIVPAAIGIAIVATIIHRFARPVRGLGIAIPMFIPPIVAALSAWGLSALFGGTQHIDAIAYVSGTIGTLIGADIVNLSKLEELGAPIASIGGAGTFDGIFLTGIIAVLLA
ncbi:MAG TPA: DUF1614 domain-containing protein [Candidatus Binataceae bacterium]|nr:DUF1614 domain-containing protein [Candidatus Binataceae bacterium]